MAAEAFIIRELTGPGREIQLHDRALPYQKLETPGLQRYVKHTYPGSRVATIQVLGPDEGDWNAEGMWKTRYLGLTGHVVLYGFDDIQPDSASGISAEDLVEAFNRVRLAGQTIEVRWGPEIRRGILHEFIPNWDRVEDVAWRATFVWSQRGDSPARRATVAFDSTSGMSRALDELDLIAAEMPSTILPAQASGLTALIDDVRSTGAQFTESLAKLQATTDATFADIQNAQTLAERVVQACNALRRGELTDLPYYNLTPLDDVTTALAVEVWRRDCGASSRRVSTEARNASSSAADRLLPGVSRVVTVTENVSLRAIAARELGSADAWTTIADANGITGSTVPAGTRIVIPRASSQGVTFR